MIDEVKAAVKVECDRQGVGEESQRDLLGAYFWAENKAYCDVLSEEFLAKLARVVEPSNDGQYRHQPVTFNGIVGGVHPREIWRAMQRWVAYFNDAVRQQEKYTANFKLCDEVIKEFLDIHPFSDGNGRTAWLLRVWMLDQWDNPQPLPDYYGKDDPE